VRRIRFRTRGRIRFRHAALVAVVLLALAVPAAIAAFVATTANTGNSFQSASIFPGAIKMASGTYAGNGADNRAITVGFQPDFVIIKDEAAREGVGRTSTMTGQDTKPLGSATALQANYIQSLTATGFTVGTNSRVNLAGDDYHWIAFKANSQAMQVGNYTGNGAGTRNITGLGFQPEMVMVLGDTGQRAVLRATGMSRTFRFDGGLGSTTGVTAFGADGFTLSNSAEVNSNGVPYHYIAFNDVANSIDVGSYNGNSADNRTIATGFQPEYALVRRDDTGTAMPTVHHPASLTGDNTLEFGATAMGTNRIQSLPATGFQVGTNGDVNTFGETYYYLAVRSSAP
jgi:hypothetical protein